MKKSELIAIIAEQANLSEEDAAKALNAAIEGIQDSLGEGDPVIVRNFGTFKVADQPARSGRNPRTGQPMNIGPRKKASFSASSGLRKAVASGTKTGGGGPGGKV